MFLMVKFPTTDFRTVKTKNLRNPRDRAPLSDSFHHNSRVSPEQKIPVEYFGFFFFLNAQKLWALVFLILVHDRLNF